MDTLARPVSQLPAQPTSFVGRDRERIDLGHQLTAVRLLTLTGVGGCGKTRLAHQVAADRLALSPQSMAWVDLDPLTDPALVPQAVALAVGLREQPGRTIIDSLVETLRNGDILLILDNCEHLVDACATLATRLLRHCPGVRLLVTSREPLGVTGEHVWPVPPLSVPTAETQHSPLSTHLSALLASEAVQLFIERAQQTEPTFALTATTASTIARLVRHLEGIPLAIELAAARVASQGLEQADHLSDLLTDADEAQRGPTRHHTLRAAMDWSYHLLSEPERALFRHLSIFAGGFTLDSAEAVCIQAEGKGLRDDHGVSGAQPSAFSLQPSEILDLLTHLVDKSLLVTTAQGNTTRYRFLEPVREYAWDKLTEAGEASAASQAHITLFCQLAEDAEPQLRGREQREWIQRLAQENDNLRTALTRCLEQREDNPHQPSSLLSPLSSTALRLAGALWYFWYVRGQMSEGRRWLEAVRDNADALAARQTPSASPAAERAKVVHGIGALALRQGDYGEAQAAFEAALALRQALGDRRGAAYTLNNLGSLADTLGDIPQARARFEAALTVFRELGDAWGISLELNNLGQTAYQSGDIDTARTLYRESLTISREIGDGLRTALALNNLGKLATRRGEFDMARTYHQESLELTQRLGEKRTLAETLGFLSDVALGEGNHTQAWEYVTQSLQAYHQIGERTGVVAGLERRARLAFAVGDIERAARLLGAAQGVRDALHVSLPSPDREDVAHLRAACEARDRATFAALYTEGLGLPLEEAIDLALAPLAAMPASLAPPAAPNRPPASPALAGLTARERDVAALVAQGLANRAVAESLRIGERTVETHVSNILTKLGLSSRTQVAEWVKTHQ